MSAQTDLCAWYDRVRRDLPWRRTRDPYRILVSEVMLQQTQVDRVLPFYERWLAAFPDAAALADAPLEQVHRLWKGLGYPSRAERLQRSCQAVLGDLAGAWPRTPEELQRLPGIGPYTAAAVACFAFGAVVPLVDTNVARVYARRDSLPLPVPQRRLWEHAERELGRDDPVRYNNALMELGALVCTARAPDCPRCPWRGRCGAAGDPERQRLAATPLKVATPRTAYGARADRSKPRLRIVLALIHHDGRYLVARRPAHLPSGGAWELPGGKVERGEDDRAALARELREELGVELLAARPFVRWDHDAGDRWLCFHCYRCRLFDPEAARALASDGLRWVTPQDFVTLPFPDANAAVLARFRRYHRLPAQEATA